MQAQTKLSRRSEVSRMNLEAFAGSKFAASEQRKVDWTNDYKS